MNKHETPARVPVRISAQEMRTVKITDLVPYARNAKRHNKDQIEKLRSSLREFGFVSPVLIDEAGNVLAGHGRLEAARAEGMTEVPCVSVAGMSEAQRRAYILADNRLTELGEWDMDALRFEMQELGAMHFDTSLTGFELDARGAVLFDEAQTAPSADALTTEGAEGDADYAAFVGKFKRKLTTDDCYTPPNVYEAVRGWAVERYGLQGAQIVRPFYPGGDYQTYDYPEDCVVIDNPPFSIISAIVRWYMDNGIRFFLFAPALTLFSVAAGSANYIATSAPITYENGANVRTGFVHNLGEFKLETSPELYSAVVEANAENTAPDVELPDYIYPDEVCTPIRLAPMARYERFAVRADACRFVRALDEQKEAGKALYGGGFLLSEKAAAEKAAAEKAAAEKAAAERRHARYWELSEREREVVASLG